MVRREQHHNAKLKSLKEKLHLMRHTSHCTGFVNKDVGGDELAMETIRSFHAMT